MQLQVENRPDGSYRIRNADGDSLFESDSGAEVQAFTLGYSLALGVAVKVMRGSVTDGIEYLTGLKAEAAGVMWGERV